jgi:hypothetical protein
MGDLPDRKNFNLRQHEDEYFPNKKNYLRVIVSGIWLPAGNKCIRSATVFGVDA